LKQSKNNFVFLLDEHNSIDQITPLIYVLHKQKFSITAIKCNISYNYDEDNNIDYIKKLSNDIKFFDLIRKTDFITKITLKFIHKIKNFTKRNYFKYYCNKLKKIENILLEKTRKRFLSKNFSIDDYINRELIKPIIICELSYGDIIYQHIVTRLYEQRFKIYSFNHGFDVLKNDLLGLQDLEFKLLKENERINHSVATVFFSKNSITRYSKFGENLKVLPSLRFSTYWIKKIINRENLYEQVIPQSEFKIKILLCMSAMCNNIWSGEQYRLIRLLAKIEIVHLYIKVHPREVNLTTKLNQEFSEYNNIIVVGKKVPSSTLINISDIVLTISSGMFVEAIIQGKVLIYIKYLHCNSIVLDDINYFDEFDHISIVNTRDELLKLINGYTSTLPTNIRTINRIQFLKDYILDDDFDFNSKKYIELLTNN